MKKLFLSLLATVFAVTTQAQIVKDLEYPVFHMGIRGAVTSTTTMGSLVDSSDAGSWFSGGLAMDFRLGTQPIYLETGLYYMGKKCIYDTDYGHDREHDDLYASVMMPVLASYHLYISDNMSIQPFLGLYAGYDIQDFDETNTDVGIRAGVGFNLGRLYLNVGYDYGLLEMDEYNINPGTLFATIGFNFVGGY